MLNYQIHGTNILNVNFKRALLVANHYYTYICIFPISLVFSNIDGFINIIFN